MLHLIADIKCHTYQSGWSSLYHPATPNMGANICDKAGLTPAPGADLHPLCVPSSLCPCVSGVSVLQEHIHSTVLTPALQTSLSL